MRRFTIVLALAAAAVGCETLLAGETFTGGPTSTPKDAAVTETSTRPPAPDGGEVDAAVLDAGTDAAAVDPYAAAVLADKPVAYWRLDEVAGPVFHDELHARDLTIDIVTAVMFSEPGAVHGRSIHLDGHADLTMTGTLDLSGTRPFTIEAWMRPTDTSDTYRRVFEKMSYDAGNPLGGTYFWVNAAHRLVGFERWLGGDQTDDVYENLLPPADTFTHFVVAVGGSRTIMYRNGDAVAETGSDIVTRASDPDVPVHWGNNFIGWLDELAVYDTTLSGTQVHAHFAASKLSPP